MTVTKARPPPRHPGALHQPRPSHPGRLAQLSLETGDPVGRIELIAPFRRPLASVASALPNVVSGGESQMDDLAWRLVAQLSLNHLSLAEPGQDAEPLRAMLDLYAGRGDPAMARHARSITRVRSRQVVERLGIPGPICFGHGVEITLDIEETTLAGGSTLLLSALLNQLFARHAAINSFVRTKTISCKDRRTCRGR